jgi:hypothetical protein
LLKVMLLSKNRCCRSGAAAHSTDRRLLPPVVLLTIEALPRYQAEPASTGCGFLLAVFLRMEALMTAATVHIAAAPSQA